MLARRPDAPVPPEMPTSLKARLLKQGAYEYRAFIRNLTSGSLTWTLSFGSFPGDASLAFDRPFQGVLAPYAGETLRFGRGSSAAMTLETVEVLYDREGGVEPFMNLRDCLVRPG
jgi:hypothetical protein